MKMSTIKKWALNTILDLPRAAAAPNPFQYGNKNKNKIVHAAELFGKGASKQVKKKKEEKTLKKLEQRHEQERTNMELIA